MDYLVSEGYPAAAEKFAQETNLCAPSDIEGIRERVRIRTAIYKGDLSEAVGLINEVDAEVRHIPPAALRDDYNQVSCTTHIPSGVDDSKLTTSVLSMISATRRTIDRHSCLSGISTDICWLQILDKNPLLHFHLLQLQLIEIIRGILAQPSAPTATDFLPAIKFATEQLSPRAPTDPQYQQALERTMALMIYPPEKMAPEFKELLDVKLREKVATEVNQAILESKGERREAKIRQLVRSRAWAETQARDAKVQLPSHISIGLDLGDEMAGIERNGNGEAMAT